MNTKYLNVVLGFLLAALMVTPALAAQSVPAVKVVDLGAYGKTTLSDAELAGLAKMDVADNPEIFPAISGFGLRLGSCSEGVIEGSYANYPMTSSDAIGITGEIMGNVPYRFSAIVGEAKSDSYPVAVVKPDGTVERFDEGMGVSEDGVSLSSTACLLAQPGDTVLTFAQSGSRLGPPAAGFENVNGIEGNLNPLTNNEDSESPGGNSGGNSVD